MYNEDNSLLYYCYWIEYYGELSKHIITLEKISLQIKNAFNMPKKMKRVIFACGQHLFNNSKKISYYYETFFKNNKYLLVTLCENLR